MPGCFHCLLLLQALQLLSEIIHLPDELGVLLDTPQSKLYLSTEQRNGVRQ